MSLNVLVGCEHSGTVRDAFRALGHNAMSCDLLPTDVPGPHYQGDVRDLLDDEWDLAIFHPDCTYLTRSGQRWLNSPDDDRPGKLKGAPRWAATALAVDFFRELQATDIHHVAIENPRPGTHVSGQISTPTQFVQPYMFGHHELKATGFWLKNLPPLVPTVDDVKAEQAATMALPKRERSKVHFASPGKDRWKIRSLTYPGIAAAMADQWSRHVLAEAEGVTA